MTRARLLLAAVLVFATLALSGFAPQPVSAASSGVAANCQKSFLGLPSWYQYLNVGPEGDDPCAFLPLGSDAEFNWAHALPRIGLAITDILLRVAGLVALGYTIYGGIRYILSQGQPDSTKKAKGTIVGASIGLIISIFAATIVGFIGATLWK